MSLKLSVLKTNVIKTFIIVIFVFSAALKNEDRLLSKINKMFTRFFLVKDFLKFDFLREIITTTIQFTNLIKKVHYILVLYRQLNNFLFNSIKKAQ